MNKQELAAAVATQTGLAAGKALEVVEAIFSTKPGEGIIATELAAGRKVAIFGFGAFTPRLRAARKGRNPATGEEITIPARKHAQFSAGKGLKNRF